MFDKVYFFFKNGKLFTKYFFAWQVKEFSLIRPDQSAVWGVEPLDIFPIQTPTSEVTVHICLALERRVLIQAIIFR